MKKIRIASYWKYIQWSQTHTHPLFAQGGCDKNLLSVNLKGCLHASPSHQDFAGLLVEKSEISMMGIDMKSKT